MSERSTRLAQQQQTASATKDSLVNKTALVKSTRNQPKFQEGEKILCYHGALIYEAKCLKVERSSSNEYLYFVHYNGWNKNWDEWVNFKRILKYNDENLKKQQELIVASRYGAASKTPVTTAPVPVSSNTKANSTTTQPKKEETQENLNKKESSRNINTNTNNSSSNNSSINSLKKRKITSTISNSNISPLSLTSSTISSNINSLSSNESSYDTEPNAKKLCIVDIYSKNKNIIFNPKFTIHFPESLKEWLIDDFDFVIQQNKILRLPSRKSVSSILKEYLKMKQNEDSVKNEYSSRLNETINGLIRYFNSMLGSQLLYKFERVQYTDVLKMKKQMSDIYGPIHLLRLFERLNQMILYAPLEDLSLEVLIFYVNDILRHLDKDNKILIETNDYILAPPHYVRAAI